jgi:hypothetical protein
MKPTNFLVVGAPLCHTCFAVSVLGVPVDLRSPSQALVETVIVTSALCVLDPFPEQHDGILNGLAADLLHHIVLVLHADMYVIPGVISAHYGTLVSMAATLKIPYSMAADRKPPMKQAM